MFIYSLLLATILVACHRVPLSNRSQFLLVSDSEMNAMAFSSYKEFLDTSSVVSASDPSTIMVKRVGDNIANAAKNYFASIGHSEYL
nr:M48 family peptidase [Pseudarcicella sp.]